MKMVLSKKPVMNQQRRIMMSVPAGLTSALRWRARADVLGALSLLVWPFSVSLSPRDWEESLVEYVDMIKIGFAVAVESGSSRLPGQIVKCRESVPRIL